MLFRNVESLCQNDESKTIAAIVLESTKKSRPENVQSIINMDQWRNFKCSLNLKIRTSEVKDRNIESNENSFCSSKSSEAPISTSSEYTATFDFFHFLILSKKFKLLFHFLNTFEKEIHHKGVHMQYRSGEGEPCRKESWIYGANYLHMAIKYSPEALAIFLEDSNERFINLVNEPSTMRNVYPLHLAAMNHSNLATKLLLNQDSKMVRQLDSKEYTPLFYAAAEGSLANLMLLLEKGSGDGGQVETGGKNVLFKANSYDTVMLLCKYGADSKLLRANKDDTETALKYLVSKNNMESPVAFLDNQLDEIGGDIITLDFDIFMKNEKKQLDMHSHFVENGRNDLLLHPLMEVFLRIKWRQVKWLFAFEFAIRLLFVLSLSYTAWRFMALTTCEYDKDDGKEGFVPKDNDTFSPKVNNFLYFFTTGELNGTRLNSTHSYFISSYKSTYNSTTIPATCKNDNLK